LTANIFTSTTRAKAIIQMSDCFFIALILMDSQTIKMALDDTNTIKLLLYDSKLSKPNEMII